jgi:tetratricopeptide (TPR) repeat protein
MVEQSDRAREAGNLVEALDLLEQVAKTPHESKSTLLRLGIVYYLLGRFHDARSALEAALKLDADNAEALRYLAATLSGMGEFRHAITAAERAIALGPADAQTHNLLGVVHMQQGTFEEAAAHFHRALEIDPSDAMPLENLEVLRARFGGANIGVERLENTEAIRLRLIASLTAKLDDGSINSKEADQLASLTNNRRETFAIAHRIAQRFQDDAALTSSFATTLAVVRQNAGELAQALALRERAYALAPNHVETGNGLGWLLIAEGGARFGEGWKLFSETARVLNPRNFPDEVPNWRGEDLHGRKLFVFAEQGLGDALLALRFIPLLRARGIAVTLWVPSAIAGLACSISGHAEFYTSDARPDARALGCSHACGLLELVAAMNLSREDIKAAPRLSVPGERATLWADRIGLLPGKKVALTSVGNANRIDDWLRTVPVDALAPLAAMRGVSWVNVSVDDRDERRLAVDRLRMFDAALEFTDFVDTAAVLAAVDAVVAIDCAAAHVAGSLGKPLFLFKPTVIDWRWRIGSDETPWWPGTRVFEAQAPGRWDDAAQRLALELDQFLGGIA